MGFSCAAWLTLQPSPWLIVPSNNSFSGLRKIMFSGVPRYASTWFSIDSFAHQSPHRVHRWQCHHAQESHVHRTTTKLSQWTHAQRNCPWYWDDGSTTQQEPQLVLIHAVPKAWARTSRLTAAQIASTPFPPWQLHSNFLLLCVTLQLTRTFEYLRSHSFKNATKLPEALFMHSLTHPWLLWAQLVSTWQLLAGGHPTSFKEEVGFTWHWKFWASNIGWTPLSPDEISRITVAMERWLEILMTPLNVQLEETNNLV